MKTPEKNWLEWCCFGLSLLLVVAVLGYLARDAFKAGDEPPKIEFQLGETEPRGEEFRVPVAVHNHGDVTAESVHVEIVLKSKGSEERAAFVIDHLPKHGRRDSYVTFHTDPRTAESLRARALGYQTP